MNIGNIILSENLGTKTHLFGSFYTKYAEELICIKIICLVASLGLGGEIGSDWKVTANESDSFFLG